ncbi:OsmC family protein [Streptomyces sp. B6B3]|uniref:OsmC family protein n=1 Tax=Streptomyces sp. B6B3 TaxID=3153570 RepID=UPI00325E1B3E
MHKMDVVFVAGESYRITVRGHDITVDQPLDASGDDRAPTPLELFVASLASCVAFYAGRYLARHGMSRDALRVETTYAMADHGPSRVTDVRMRVIPPAPLDPARRHALAAVVDHCTVHNTLRQPLGVTVNIG